MEILGNRSFVEVPGTATHELPPLLVRMTHGVRRLDRVMEMAGELIEQEALIPFLPAEQGAASNERAGLDAQRRRMDLAVNLVDQYLGVVQHWRWGDGIVEWIRQCEATFGSRVDLRNLLRPDVWQIGRAHV